MYPLPVENDRQFALIFTFASSIVVPSFLVVLRFCARRATRRPFDASDWCISVALLANIALQIDMCIMTLMGGFGFHVVEILTRFGPEVAVHFFKGILAFAMIWNLTVCLSKLSVLFMYASLIPASRMVMACKVLGLFIVLWNAAGMLGALLICRPFAFNWDKTLPGNCGDVPLYYTIMGFINIFVEVAMLLLPVRFLYRLQLKLAKRLSLISLFSIGRMTLAVSIYRQAILPGVDFSDMPHTGVLATILTAIEAAIALSLACVPFLPALFHRSSGSTSIGSRYSSNANGNGPSRPGPFEVLNESVVQLRPVSHEAGPSAESDQRPSRALTLFQHAGTCNSASSVGAWA